MCRCTLGSGWDEESADMTEDTLIHDADNAAETRLEPAASPKEALYQWIAERRPESQYCPAQIFNSILLGGWSREAAVAAMQDVMGDMIQPREFDAFLRGTPMPDMSNSPSALTVEGHEVKVLLELQDPKIMVFSGFLTDDECDQLIDIARSRLERSGTVADAWGNPDVVSDVRTSYGTFLRRGEFDVCNRIDARVQALVNWPTDFTEDLQILHYTKGAEYKPHHDYFDTSAGPWTSLFSRGGNRCGTLIMYLNTPKRGGGTVFPDMSMETFARKGAAVFFSYPVAEASSRSLHGGSPVIEGEKWAATKWFRQGPHR